MTNGSKFSTGFLWGGLLTSVLILSGLSLSRYSLEDPEELPTNPKPQIPRAKAPSLEIQHQTVTAPEGSKERKGIPAQDPVPEQPAPVPQDPVTESTVRAIDPGSPPSPRRFGPSEPGPLQEEPLEWVEQSSPEGPEETPDPIAPPPEPEADVLENGF